MTIETQLNFFFDHVLKDKSPLPTAELIRCMDLTLLNEGVSKEELSHFDSLAHNNPIAAVCVYSQYFNQLKKSSHFNWATVINFPYGNHDLSTCINEIEIAMEFNVKEIDYVFPYQAYLAGEKDKALNHCRAIVDYCKNHELTLKIILETGAFPDIQSIYHLSSQLLITGCDFLKTSTGKIAQGASLSSVFAILSAIKDVNSLCGIKVSGGLKTPHQAQIYACLAEAMMDKKISKDWFRLGASTLLEELLKIKTLTSKRNS